MTDYQAMLDAHVRFELDRLTGAGLEQSVRDEVAALFAWAGDVRVADVAPAPVLADAAARLVEEVPMGDGVVALVGDVVAAAHRVLLDDERTVGDVLPLADVERLVAVLADMGEARRELLDVLTTSQAYTQLVGHVLYRGVKSFALTENVVARKVPGAASLVRLGQRGLASAAPGLEGNVDRQLSGFVQANIADTLRESQRFLDGMLDAELLTSMAREAWQENAGRGVADVAALVEPAQVDELVLVMAEVVRRLRDEGVLGPAVAAVVTEVLTQHADRVVADLLDEAGVTEDLVVQGVLDTIGPAVEHAAATGQLEARIRGRLEPFYASYKRAPAGGARRSTRRSPTG